MSGRDYDAIVIGGGPASRPGAEIKRQARADKIKVRTGFNDGIVWALRVRSPHSDALAAGTRYSDLLARTVPLAAELRHEPILAVRDGDKMICAPATPWRQASAPSSSSNPAIGCCSRPRASSRRSCMSSALRAVADPRFTPSVR